MKKKKRKLREKIKNKPKARSHPRNKNETIPSRSPNSLYKGAAAKMEEDGTDVMSQVIWDFAAPLLETCHDLDSEKKAISLAIFIWNASLLPEQERIRTIDRYMADCQNILPTEEIKILSSLIDRLVQDKAEHYPTNRKKIANCTFGDFEHNRRIEVGYTLE
jgi:hypothetical protein